MSAIAAKPFCARPAVAQRSVAVAAKPSRAMRVVAFSAPKPADIEKAIKEAEDTCAGGATGECAAAWDTVEELSAAASHAKASSASTDPLEDKRIAECEADPSQPECKVFDD